MCGNAPSCPSVYGSALAPKPPLFSYPPTYLPQLKGEGEGGGARYLARHLGAWLPCLCAAASPLTPLPAIGPPTLPTCEQLKERQGILDRILEDGCSAICRGLFKKETDVSVFEGAAVTTGLREAGYIEGR